jgi:hypothetical protein
MDNVKSKEELIKYYQRITLPRCNYKFAESVRKMIYIENLDRLAFFEKGSD